MQKNKESLAIFGGDPIRKNPMPFREAFGSAEKQKIQEVIYYYTEKNQDPPYQGYFENLFCEKFSEYMGGGYTDAVSTGTASIYVALAALDLPKGSEVIISPVTDSSPLNCIILQGYIPAVADSQPNSYNIGLEQFSERITNKTSALLVIHAAGEPVHQMDQIAQEAAARGIKILEDCSQAPGALVNGEKVGTFGDISAFSTMYRKNLASGGSGGLVFTKNEKLFHLSLAHADRGKQIWRTDLNLNDPRSALFPALNFNTNEFSCAIGLASLERLEETIRKRNIFLSKLVDILPKETKICLPYAHNQNFSPFYFPIFVDEKKIRCSKVEFANALLAEGIGLLPEYGCLVTDWKWAKKYLIDDFETINARTTRDHSFNLFLNEKYDEKEIEDIITAIKKIESFYMS
ncbi:MAG: DegT/DnrJ/EryC1/StrS family aminotransferase [Gammaproteobacteria bacterium]|nr:DegT/DnrJ/EryC1/StrS family aminotransferase [Gammaproteobacteria bacterium]